MRLTRLIRVVPRVAPLQPQLCTAALCALWVGAGSAGGATMRLRLGAAAVAAASCFVFDDPAGQTLAAVPVTRMVRRLARFAVGAGIVAAWVIAAVVITDARFGTGRPPAAAFLEIAVVGLIATAVALVAMERSADERGGATGCAVALLCVATMYLPPRWWWPLTAEPRVTRLAVIGAAAITAALAASADPAKRWRIA